MYLIAGSQELSLGLNSFIEAMQYFMFGRNSKSGFLYPNVQFFSQIFCKFSKTSAEARLASASCMVELKQLYMCTVLFS
jgi:hypothetical protein